MARAAVIPAASPPRATRTAKRTTTTTSRAGAKPAAKTTKAKAPTSATEGRKRTARTNLSSMSKPADEDTDEDTDDELGLMSTTEKSSTTKARGRPAGSTTATTGRGRKPTTTTSTRPGTGHANEDDEAHADGQKKRVGRPRTKPATETESATAAPKQRGRPKGSTNAKSTTAAADAHKKARALAAEDASSQGPKEVTITTNSTLMRSNLLRGPAKKKTVTFKEVSDSDDFSEPSPPPPAGRRRPAERPAGLAAKPSRKGTPTAARGRKPAATKKGASKPLSPKKATQVAKGISSYASSDGEDDELSITKDQNKLHVDSPNKHGSEQTGLGSPVKRINFTSSQPPKTVDENGQPTLQPPKSVDFSDAAFLSSPARRPPPSPFSFSIRETPRRGLALPEDPKSIAQPNFTPTDNSPLKSSPRKANLDTPRRGNLGFDDLRPLSQPNFTPGQNSPLKSSPKKGLFGASFMSQPSLQESSTPLKRSLLQSPAKKVASPFKSSLLFSRSLMTEHVESDSNRGKELETAPPPKVAETSYQRYDSEETLEMPDDEETPASRYDADTPEPEVEPEFIDGSNDISHTPQSEMEDETHGQNFTHTDEADEADEAAEDVVGDLGINHEDTASEPEKDMKDVDDGPEEPLDPVAMDCEGTVESDGVDVGLYELFEGQNEIVENILMEDDFEQDNFQERLETYVPAIPEDYTICLDVAEQDAYETAQYAESMVDAEIDNEHDTAEDRISVMSNVDEDIFTLENQQGDESEEEEYESEDNLPNEEPVEFASRERMLEGLEDVFTEGPAGTSEMPRDEETEDYAEAQEVAGDQIVDPNLDYEEEEVNRLNDYAFDEEEVTLVAFDTPGRTLRQTPRRTPRRTSRRVSERTPRPTSTQSPRHTPAQGLRQTPEQTPQQMPQQPSEQMPRETPEPTPQPRALTPEVYAPYEIEEPPTPQVPNYFYFVPQYFASFAPPRFPDEYRDTAVETSFDAADNTTTADLPIPDVQPSPQPQNQTPGPEKERRQRPRFTLLAEQLSEWKASSPKKTEQRRSGRRGIFSLSGSLSGPSNVNTTQDDVSYPDLSAKSQSPVVDEPQPNEEPVATEDEYDLVSPEMGRCAFEDLEKSPGLPMFEIFSDEDLVENKQTDAREDTQVSIVYESPLRPAASTQETLDDEKENYEVQLPAPATPVRGKTSPLQTFHTVSKVPLKPEGEVSPLKVSRKRGRSLSITSPTRSSPRLRKSILALQEDIDFLPPRKAPRLSYSTMPQLQPTRSRSSSRVRDATQVVERERAPSRSPSPAKSHRRRSSIVQPTPTGALQGAVVYVDVHTTEGEDASGIFVELLQQMGARCVKNWSWNPRSSVSPDEQAETREGKVGITHVVYKDGGVRTMEKVRQAAGLVKCVGVGWVLDCERENKWLDEAHYAVDSSIIPRGGAKRRKSMEPRALSNVNGTLVKADAGSRRSGVGAADFARTSTSTARDAPSTPKRSKKSEAGYPGIDPKYFQTPKTPAFTFNMDSVGMSPATPFFLSQRSKLVQQTCPPKQIRQGLFSNSGPSEEQSQKLRVKLEAARRKSLAFKPKIGSPLVP
ncbi:hypothetical protein BDV38DRAFT_286398 [Aspergillus pseudotamarii]|uniref:BRCT domain-containing protein n=1 Tax=Aspergillus pseudotamarii TaxID=132259 RepID=A0A5N6SJ43_ASPPS|nr:uncharacterized protein BDV38DRAFT_286398 [Aspergillus pseudotamarii]KAE8133919.1 hypothetical protein BDV38DRAFT_286398 [Aspergillus pseudotamarii]